MEYITHLSKDKKLKKLIDTHGAFKLKKRKDICLHLVASIMSQQLSVKVADVIYKRFLALFETENPTPEMILKINTEKLRSIGLSGAKTNYVQNVARFAIEQGLDSRKLSKMTNDELIDYLTQIKGVGRWTVEMQLMFTLGREDIFSIDDLGIQNAMKYIYKLDDTEKKKFKLELIRISRKWAPYRTYACMHLWRFKDS